MITKFLTETVEALWWLVGDGAITPCPPLDTLLYLLKITAGTVTSLKQILPTPVTALLDC